MGVVWWQRADKLEKKQKEANALKRVKVGCHSSFFCPSVPAPLTCSLTPPQVAEREALVMLVNGQLVTWKERPAEVTMEERRRGRDENRLEILRCTVGGHTIAIGMTSSSSSSSSSFFLTFSLGSRARLAAQAERKAEKKRQKTQNGRRPRGSHNPDFP